MEYIRGRTLETAEPESRPRLRQRVADAIRHLWQIHIPPGHSPGPLGGGHPRGYVWSDNGASISFKTLKEMEYFMNQCLELKNKRLKSRNLAVQPTVKLNFRSTNLVLCHTDLSQRNIIVTETVGICFLNWAFAENI